MAKTTATATKAPSLPLPEIEGFTSDQLEQIQGIIEAMMPKAVLSNRHAGDLYIMRYRRGSTGVQTAFIRATTLERAILVGQKWCNHLPGCRFISVNAAVIATEDLLDEGAVAFDPNVPQHMQDAMGATA